MDAIEKRARELVMAEIPDLAKECFGYQRMTVVNLHVVMRILRAALTPPEGYVLVPVEPTEEMVEAICTEHGSGGWPQGYSCYAQHLRREHAFEGYRAMLAARPEVP
ncbi:TPA: hypothetical protein ACOD97_000191 [Stenotrophomonas maltophilia]